MLQDMRSPHLGPGPCDGALAFFPRAALNSGLSKALNQGNALKSASSDYLWYIPELTVFVSSENLSQPPFALRALPKEANMA